MTSEQIFVGIGRREITPPVGVPLSGFIFREGAPSLSVDDPLWVRVLALGDLDQPHWLVNFDLLGLSFGPVEQIMAALQDGLGDIFNPQYCVLTATHTHSGPPVSPIEGENGVGQAYIDSLCQQTLQAAREAYKGIQPAYFEAANMPVEGLTFNRRIMLADGRMTMSQEPGLPAFDRRPVDNLATLVVFRSSAGQAIAGLLHFACHGVALQTQAISGDIPGELARRFEGQIGAPCLFLQGASGDVNPTCVVTDRKTLLEWCDRFMEQASPMLGSIMAQERASNTETRPAVIHSLIYDLPFEYAPLPPRQVVLNKIRDFDHIAKGEWDAPEVQPTLQWLGDMLNMPPGQLPDRGKASFISLAFANAGRRTLATLDGGGAPSCPLRTVLWQVGDLTLAFAAVEMFASTGLALRELAPGRLLLPVSHTAPVIGYLPDRYAIRQGGYEVNDAWQFYRQPAPFAEDSEEKLVGQFQKMLSD